MAWAYDVAVMPVKGVNLQPGQPEAIGVILAQEYAKASGYQVAGPDITRAALKGGTDYSAASRELGAGEYLETVAVLLDSKLIVSVERHEYTGKVIHTVSMPGVTMDDVPEIAHRLSRALLLKTTPEETRTVDTVTKAEGQPVNQTATVVPKGVKSSIILPVVKGVETEPMASLAFELRIERPDFFLGVAAGAMIPANSSDRSRYGGLFAEFSGSYFFTRQSFSPYAGAGISPRLLIASSGGVGLAPFAHIGATFPRDSKAHGFVEFRVAQNVLPMPKNTVYADSGNPLGGSYPTELSGQFGIVW